MYRKNQYHQYSITDFNQPIGLKKNPENRWVKKATMIPWYEIEDKYAKLFPSKTGLPGYQTEAPFVPSLLVGFRKRLTEDVFHKTSSILKT